MAKGLAQQCDDLKASKGNYISFGGFFLGRKEVNATLCNSDWGITISY